MGVVLSLLVVICYGSRINEYTILQLFDLLYSKTVAHHFSAVSQLLSLLPFFSNLDLPTLIDILSSLVLPFNCSAAQTWLGITSDSPEGLLKHSLLDPTCRDSDLGALGWDLRICIAHQFSMPVMLQVQRPCAENDHFAMINLTELSLHLPPSSWVLLKKNYHPGWPLSF